MRAGSVGSRISSKTEERLHGVQGGRGRGSGGSEQGKLVPSVVGVAGAEFEQAVNIGGRSFDLVEFVVDNKPWLNAPMPVRLRVGGGSLKSVWFSAGLVGLSKTIGCLLPLWPL